MRRLIYTIVILAMSASVVCAQDYEKAFQEIQKSFEQRSENAPSDLNKYLEDYPYTPYTDEVLTMSGVLLSEKGEPIEAIKTMTPVHVGNLSRAMESMYYFHHGYAHMQIKEYKNALPYFQQLIKNQKNPYTLQAKYYIGYCYYSLKEYGKALVQFLELEQIGGYRKIAPYYIVQIHFALSEYDQVLKRAEKLLKEYPNNAYNDELHRMVGEIYYQDSIYDKAANHLESYHVLRVTNNKEVLRNDLYLLGVSNYRIAKYDLAINYLKQVKLENDSISESTCLHLGHSYLRIQNIEKAILAYSTAIEFGINPRLREEAMYNYVQATYLQNSALGESITAFQTFIKEYPCSKYIDKVYALMADMYMTSKNYAAALEALLEIQHPNEKVIKTRQYLRYQLAVDAFLQDKMSEAIQWGNEVISNEPTTSEYKTESYYLCAQAYFHLHEYKKAVENIDLYQQQTNIALSNNQKTAIYLKAYALFNQKDYSSASHYYKNYVVAIGNDSSNMTYPDALNRLGDCFFHERQFQEAVETYTKVINLKSTGADYAAMQCGYAQGLMHQYTEKVNVLEQLIEQYPYSDYVDDALYEIARAELLQENHEKAIRTYNTLINNHPNSKRAAKASLELGMTYRTIKQFDAAVDAFKATINTYTGSEEAYSALEGMEQIYVERNQVEEYLAYTQTIANINMQKISSEDSLVYITAELQYMKGNLQQAIKGMTTYLENYCPGGRYCMSATYYAARSYYQLKEYNQAIEQFSALTEIPGNPYMEEACMRVAELCYDKQEYRTALYYFQKMSEVASSSTQLTTALLGMLRCSYNVAEQTTAIDVATRLLETTGVDSLVRNEALYCRAKAYIKDKQYGLAIVDLTPVAKEVRTAQGAEAKYLLAECYYHLNSLDLAEEEIMSFAQQETSHQYWLAKSMVLLADINIARKDLFQAKQYLLALQKNYRTQDNIQTIIEEKLQYINQLETQENAESAKNQEL